MNWSCALYGHRWRHPGPKEVIVAKNGDRVHLLKCQRCNMEQLIDGAGSFVPLEHLDELATAVEAEDGATL